MAPAVGLAASGDADMASVNQPAAAPSAAPSAAPAADGSGAGARSAPEVPGLRHAEAQPSANGLPPASGKYIADILDEYERTQAEHIRRQRAQLVSLRAALRDYLPPGRASAPLPGLLADDTVGGSQDAQV